MRTSLISIAAGLALLASGAVSAQGYVGGGLGWARIGVDCTDVPNCDKTATGGKLYGGYMVGQQFGVELSYFDWGKVTASGVIGNVGRLESPMATTGLMSGKLRATGVGLAVAYIVPVSSDWSGTVRAGIMQNKGKVTVDGFDGSFSKNATFPHIGFGLGYRLSPGLYLTGEADFSRVKWGVDGVYEKEDVQLISIGLRYSF